jgi:hypothetical protein
VTLLGEDGTEWRPVYHTFPGSGTVCLRGCKKRSVAFHLISNGVHSLKKVLATSIIFYFAVPHTGYSFDKCLEWRSEVVRNSFRCFLEETNLCGKLSAVTRGLSLTTSLLHPRKKLRKSRFRSSLAILAALWIAFASRLRVRKWLRKAPTIPPPKKVAMDDKTQFVVGSGI